MQEKKTVKCCKFPRLAALTNSFLAKHRCHDVRVVSDPVPYRRLDWQLPAKCSWTEQKSVLIDMGRNKNLNYADFGKSGK